MKQRARMRGWQQAIASLALVLFAFQSYLTQTHIHLLWQIAPAANGQVANSQAAHSGTQRVAPRDKAPPGDSPAKCPICQDIALAGHFTAPGAIAFTMPQPIAAAITIVAAIPAAIAATSHDWRGRAPPRI